MIIYLSRVPSHTRVQSIMVLHGRGVRGTPENSSRGERIRKRRARNIAGSQEGLEKSRCSRATLPNKGLRAMPNLGSLLSGPDASDDAEGREKTRENQFVQPNTVPVASTVLMNFCPFPSPSLFAPSLSPFFFTLGSAKLAQIFPRGYVPLAGRVARGTGGMGRMGKRETV